MAVMCACRLPGVRFASRAKLVRLSREHGTARECDANPFGGICERRRGHGACGGAADIKGRGHGPCSAEACSLLRSSLLPLAPARATMGAQAAHPYRRRLARGQRRHRGPRRRRRSISVSTATVIVDSKTGARRLHRAEGRGQCAPDGYTVGIGIMGQLAVAPVVPGSQIPLDLDKELLPICNLVGVPMVLIVRPECTLQDRRRARRLCQGQPWQGVLRPRPASARPTSSAPNSSLPSGRAEAEPRSLSRRRCRRSPTWRPARSTSSSATSRS